MLLQHRVTVILNEVKDLLCGPTGFFATLRMTRA